MFFEASSIRCRKKTCDVKKVTYNMYSYDISCMSREMMEKDGRDSAKCQKSKLRDMIGIIEMLNDNRTKVQIVIISYLKRPKQNVKGGECVLQ